MGGDQKRDNEVKWTTTTNHSPLRLKGGAGSEGEDEDGTDDCNKCQNPECNILANTYRYVKSHVKNNKECEVYYKHKYPSHNTIDKIFAHINKKYYKMSTRTPSQKRKRSGTNNQTCDNERCKVNPNSYKYLGVHLKENEECQIYYRNKHPGMTIKEIYVHLKKLSWKYVTEDIKKVVRLEPRQAQSLFLKDMSGILQVCCIICENYKSYSEKSRNLIEVHLTDNNNIPGRLLSHMIHPSPLPNPRFMYNQTYWWCRTCCKEVEKYENEKKMKTQVDERWHFKYIKQHDSKIREKFIHMGKMFRVQVNNPNNHVLRIKEDPGQGGNTIIQPTVDHLLLWQTPSQGIVEEEKDSVDFEMEDADNTNDLTSSTVNIVEEHMSIKELLLLRFGHHGFKSKEQEDAIKTLMMERNDVFISMPTGSGKSLVYQLPAVAAYGKVTVIISPLIALIKDQIDHMKKKNIHAITLNSYQSKEENGCVKAYLRNPSTSLLYITPEQCKTRSFKRILSNLERIKKLAYFIVDEAHCVSAWGNDFRPSYLDIGQLRSMTGGAKWAALTATASPQVMEEIKLKLRLRETKAFKLPCFRNNIYYDVYFKDGLQDEMSHLKSFIEETINITDWSEDWKQDRNGGCGIIYCRTRKDTETLAANLRKNGIPCLAYNAGMEAEIRKTVQEKWMDGVVPVITATSAFGMGVDKATVRFVAHWYIPHSLAAYYQESGRAGRDGLPSYSRVYYSRMERKV